MKILGNRLLVTRVEEEKKEGFQTVEVQDSFIYKGRIEQVGEDKGMMWTGTSMQESPIKVGMTVLFAKYSPHSQDIDDAGEKKKIIRMEDVLAIL
tara:strand:- start:14996 stop:15280 length:285 start_codon:yes stop_codon:yes gene_type:complete